MTLTTPQKVIVTCSIVAALIVNVRSYLFMKKTKDFSRHVEKADTFMQNGNYNAAVVEFKQAVLIKPDAAPIRDSRGDALYQSSRYGEAEKEYRYALRHTSGYPSTYFYLGSILKMNGHKSEAREMFRKAIEKDGNGPWGQDAQKSLTSE